MKKHYNLLKMITCIILMLPAFVNAQAKLEQAGNSPSSMNFEEGNHPTVSSFFEEYRQKYPLSEDNKMEALATSTDMAGTHHRYDQYYKGVQVFGAQYVLHETNGTVNFANGRILHGINLDVNPAISEQAAFSAALKEVDAKVYMWDKAENEAFLKKEQNDPNATFAPEGKLLLTSGREDLTSENIRLVYRFDVYAEQPHGRYWVDVDAKTGEVINKTSRIHTGDVPGSGTSYYDGLVDMTVDEIDEVSYSLNESTTRGAAINTYNMNNGTNYGAATNFTSTSADGPWDGVGVSGHWGAEATYDYYFDEHGRNSLDDAGFALNSYVHYSSGYNNAFWDGSRMTYGDGDGVNYTPLVGLDVVGHELTHGVTSFSSNLIYSNESGGLNESFSDIFGNLVEFEKLGVPPSGGSWRIGEQITTDGLGIRNMADPNEFNNPDTYLGLYWFYNEVHNTSGVQNFWFYLLVEGGTGTNDVGYDYNVTGIGMDDAAAIAYANNTSFLFPSATYYDARVGAIAAAESLFGAGSQQALSTAAAWDAVGVYENYEAVIDVSPTSLTFNVPLDGTDSDIITISNIGDVGPGAPDLVWTLVAATTPDPPVNVMTEVLNGDKDLLEYQEVVYDKLNVQNNKAKELSNLAETGTGGDDSSGPGVLSAGGPDAFGYSFTDSDEAGGPAFSWTDITTTGTALTLGDDAFQEIAIPFNFPFYGDVKTSVKVSSNGYLTFGIDGTDFSNDPIPIASDPNDIICAFWDDLAPNNGGTVHYLSTSAQFIVQYTDIPRFGDGSSVMTFQVILNDDGSILYQYYSMVGTLNSATVGIENATGDDGLQVAYSEAYIHDNLAVKISLPEPCPWITSVSPISGTLSPGNSDDVTVSVDATGLASGSYDCELRINSNDVNASQVIVPVTLVVDELCPELVTNTTQSTIYCTLQEAIAAANANDNITIGTGTLVESGQIVIDKNLTITGNGKAETVIMTDQNTGTSGDTRGWWLVNDGVELNLSDLTLDGTGYLIWQAIRQRGSGTIDNVRFTEIKYEESGPSYNGVAVAAFGNGNVDITNCMFDEIGRVGVLYFGAGISASNYLGNMYAGKGVGDWLDYGVEVGAGATALVNGSTFSNCTGVASVDGSTSGGVLVTTFFGPGTDATISDNLFSDNSTGVIVGFDASDGSVANVHENNFIGNDFGVQSTAPLVDAKFNYWGAENGPTHASHTCGTGDAITDNVLFIPYYKDAPRSILEDGCVTLPDAVAHWPMTEGSGATTEDVTVNTNDGTLGWGANWVTGMTDFAIGFDGINDRVNCGSGSEMDMGSGDFSISSWVKMGAQGNSYPTLIAKGGGNTTNAGYWVFFKNSVVWFYLSNGTTRLQTHSSGVNLTDNEWHHIGITVARDGNVTFYVDGENKGTSDVSSFNGQDITSSNDLTMGSWSSSSFSFLDGSMDDTRLFDVELTPEEVIELAGGDPDVNYPPVITVEATADPATVLLPGTSDLAVVAEDPNFDLLTYMWTKLSGPGDVTFTPNNDEFSDMTSASFTTDGEYTLQVEVSDGLESVFSQVDVLVLPPETMDPVAYWPMDEGSGGTAEDVTVNTNDGILYNGTSWTAGMSGTALIFDGVNDRVNAGPGSEMDMGTGDFSVSTWVKMGAQSNTYPTLLAKGGGSATNAGYWVFYKSSVIWFYLSNGTTRINARSTGVALADDAWHHVVVTIDRDGDATFYVDAVEKGTFDVSAFDGQDISTSTTFTMGSWQTSSFSYMNGSLDDMRLFNAALPAPTVASLYSLFQANKNSSIDETDIVKSDITVYPNPFNDRINIAYSVSEEQRVVISVYNIHGEEVQRIHDGMRGEGTYTTQWDGKAQNGATTPMGIYVVRIITGKDVSQKTIIRTK